MLYGNRFSVYTGLRMVYLLKCLEVEYLLVIEELICVICAANS